MAYQNSINLTVTGIVSADGAGAYNGRTITAGTGISIANGDGTAGNPTISTDGSVGIQFDGDSGSSVPSSGVLNIAGGTGITTSASGSTLTVTLDTPVSVANGGTGQSSYTDGQLLIGNSTGNTLAKATLTAGTGITINNGSGSIEIVADNNGTVTSVSGTTNRITSTGGSTPVIDIDASYVGQASITTLGTIATGTWNANVIGEVYGGTNQSTYSTGDILYASAANTLSKLAAGLDGEVLKLSGGVPSWASDAGGQVDSVSGTADRITISGTAADPIVDIASTYVGQSSIDTLGTISTGTWEATDVGVAHGGTGRSTATAYSVICGGTTGTGAHQSVSGVGTSGQVLTSNGASALPTWQDNDGGGDVTGPGSSTDNALARFDGTGGKTLQNSSVIVTDNGEMTNASQPAFLAYLGTSDSNVTGNGASFTLGSGNALTEVFDQNGDFVTTGTFTAPVTGKYMLGYSMFVGGLTSSMTYSSFSIVTSNASYNSNTLNIGGSRSVAAAPDNYSCSDMVLADMDVSDTCTFTVQINGGAGDTADLLAAGRRIRVFGSLVC